MKTFSLSELENDNKFNNLKSSFNILQNNTIFASRNGNGTSYSARLVDTLGITIDKNSITQITYDGYVSYTMLMVEPDDTSGNTSNLVIQEHNGNEHIFTVRYTNYASRNSTTTSSNFQMRSGIKSHTDFWEDDEANNGGSNTSDCEEYETVCNTVNVWIPVSCGCGHSGDDTCSGCYGMYAGWTIGTQDECEDICVNYGSNNNPSNGNPNNGSGSTYDNTDPTEVATTLVNTDGTLTDVQILINELNTVFGENNFELDVTINPDDVPEELHFVTEEELQAFFDTYSSTNIISETTIDPNNPEKVIERCTFPDWLLNFNIFIEQTLGDNYSVDDVTSNVSGVTVFVAYEQLNWTSASVIPNANLSNVIVNGESELTLVYKGVGTIATFVMNFNIHLNMSNGTKFSGTMTVD